MNRKNFLGSALASAMSIPSLANLTNSVGNEESLLPIIPKYLKEGDTIGITAPAGYITLEEIQPAVKQMESWGFQIKVGDTIGKKDFTFGGTDEERRKDFQQMLDDSKIKAIMCARGGY